MKLSSCFSLNKKVLDENRDVKVFSNKTSTGRMMLCHFPSWRLPLPLFSVQHLQ